MTDILKNAIQEQLGEDSVILLEMYTRLNAVGRFRSLEYIHDRTQLDKYTKKITVTDRIDNIVFVNIG